MRLLPLYLLSATLAYPLHAEPVNSPHLELPGVPATEQVTATPVESDTGVSVRKVSFLRSNQIVLIGNLFLPKDFDPAKTYPSVICVHPAGSVKEQSAGLYAHRLAEHGFAHCVKIKRTEKSTSLPPAECGMERNPAEKPRVTSLMI